MLFGYVRRFSPMTAHAILQADKVAGGGKFEVHGIGDMSVAFLATNDPNVLELQLREINLDFDTFSINMPGGQKKVKIPSFHVDTADIDLEYAKGVFNRSSKKISLTLPIMLNPNKIPILGKFGIFKPAKVVAVEAGKMDPETGYLETHAEPFRLPSPFHFLTVYPGQHSPSCSISASLGVVTASFCDRSDISPQEEVLICPGDGACLRWSTTGSITSAIIEPGAINVSHGGSGITRVNPTTNTQYRLKANAQDCQQEKTVTVRVVNPGQNWNLSAAWEGYGRCVWSVNVSPQFASERIIAPTIRHIRCPVTGLDLWAEWSVKHTNTDGHVTVFDARYDEFKPTGGVSLAGRWEFTPRNFETCDPRDVGKNWWENACFEVSLRC